MLPLESVPNVSEGRDGEAIAAIGEAFASQGAWLLDTHADVDHHRSVFTLVASDDEILVESLVAGVAAARERIDLRRHEGVHPRVGAADVVPLVPLRPADMPRAERAAHELARRIGLELGVTVFLYGNVGEGRRPAFFRRGGLEALQRRVEVGELVPAAGPSRVNRATGAVLVGARPPLVAFNVELATDDVGIAREVAAAVRESGGGMPGVQALGLELPRSGRIQVSLNVIDVQRAPLHEVIARVRSEAEKRGAGVVAGELVGLLPAAVLAAASGAGLLQPALAPDRVLEAAALAALA